jgi:hypothetical protein
VEVTTRSAKASPGEVSGGAAGGEGKAKNTGRGERGAGGCDRTLSCSCPAAKSKNFVSRARTTALRSVVLPAWDLEELAGPASTPPAPVLAPLWSAPEFACTSAAAVTLPVTNAGGSVP